jgi:hypothetical protein
LENEGGTATSPSLDDTEPSSRREEGEMEILGWYGLWGSPVGLSIFFAGLGVLLWGVSKLQIGEAAKAEVELKERQFNYERKQREEA